MPDPCQFPIERAEGPHQDAPCERCGNAAAHPRHWGGPDNRMDADWYHPYLGPVTEVCGYDRGDHHEDEIEPVCNECFSDMLTPPDFNVDYCFHRFTPSKTCETCGGRNKLFNVELGRDEPCPDCIDWRARA
jgi:hypothetical protein